MHDVDTLATSLGLSLDDLRDPHGWKADGSLVVSWDVVARVGGAIARGPGMPAALELARDSAQQLAEYRGVLRDRGACVNDPTPAHRGLHMSAEMHRDLLELLGDWTGRDLIQPTERYVEVYDQLQEACRLLALALPQLVRMGRRVGARELLEDIREFNKRVI